MIQNPKIRAAFQAGYNQGLEAGLRGSMAKLVIEHDLIFVYGILALILIEKRHWKKETVEALIEDIQNMWMHINDDVQGQSETMAQLVKRRTGIELDQMVQEVLEAGMEG